MEDYEQFENNQQNNNLSQDNVTSNYSENNIENSQNVQENDNKKANTLCWLAVILNIVNWFVGSFKIFSTRGFFYYMILNILSLIAFIIMIYVRIKYPKNVFGKVLMWLYIVTCIFFTLLMSAVLISCGLAINDCRGMG